MLGNFLQMTVLQPRPTVLALPSEITVVQGEPALFGVSVSGADTSTVEWDFDMGETFSPDVGASGVLDPTHIYLAAGTYTAAVRATNASGAARIAFIDVTVTDVPPTAQVNNSGPILEGNRVIINVDDPTDVNPDAEFSCLVDWENDGEFDPVLPEQILSSGPDRSLSITHFYDEDGTYPIVVRLLDGEGDYTDYPQSIVVNNAPPSGRLEASQYFITAPIRFVNVTDPSHADVLAGFTYFMRYDRYLFNTAGELILTESTGYTSYTTPEFFLSPPPRYYYIYGFVRDQDGADGPVSHLLMYEPNTVRDYGAFLQNFSTGSVTANGTVVEPDGYLGLDSGENFHIILLDSNASYTLVTNGNFTIVEAAPGVTGVSVTLSSYAPGTDFYCAPALFGRGSIQEVRLPPGNDEWGPSALNIRVRGPVGDLYGPGASPAVGGEAGQLIFHGLTGSISGFDRIGSINADADGNSVGWLGSSTSSQVSAYQGINAIRAYGIRAKVTADRYFDTSDASTLALIGDGGLERELEGESLSAVDSRGSIDTVESNLLMQLRQTAPGVLDFLYAGNTQDGTSLVGVEGATINEVLYGEQAAERLPQIQYYGLGVALVVSASDYAKNFWDTIFNDRYPKPAEMTDWQVHHTLPEGSKRSQILHGRFRRAGINVNDPTYLRGVPLHVHKEINRDWDLWRFQETKRLFKNVTDPNNSVVVRKFWSVVDLQKVQDFAAKIETQYAKYWLEASSSQKRVKELIKITIGDRNISQFKLGEGARRKSLFPKLAVGLGIFGIMVEGVGMAADIRNHTPQQAEAWVLLETHMRNILFASETGQRVTKKHLELFRDAWVTYMRELNFKESQFYPTLLKIELYIEDK